MTTEDGSYHGMVGRQEGYGAMKRICARADGEGEG